MPPQAAGPLGQLACWEGEGVEVKGPVCLSWREWLLLFLVQPPTEGLWTSLSFAPAQGSDLSNAELL